MGHAQHAVERSANLVAHGGQEVALDANGRLGSVQRLGEGQRPFRDGVFQLIFVALLVVDVNGGVQPLTDDSWTLKRSAGRAPTSSDTIHLSIETGIQIRIAYGSHPAFGEMP